MALMLAASLFRVVCGLASSSTLESRRMQINDAIVVNSDLVLCGGRGRRSYLHFLRRGVEVDVASGPTALHFDARAVFVLPVSRDGQCCGSFTALFDDATLHSHSLPPMIDVCGTVLCCAVLCCAVLCCGAVFSLLRRHRINQIPPRATSSCHLRRKHA
jgi:hypothetical protein